MDVQQQGIITLIRNGLTGESLPLPEGFSLEQAFPRMVLHQVCPLCYIGAVRCAVDKQHPVMQRLFLEYCAGIARSGGQMKTVVQICSAFDENGIDYMPLKGCNVKLLYPDPELRPMGDADILVRTAQYEQIAALMKQLGLTAEKETDHELIWMAPTLRVELHKRLIPSYNKDYDRYFGDGWRLARLQQGSRYAMTPEDEYIYLFTHFAKHYRDGGIGCRHLTDLWVYRRAHALEEDYVERELGKLQLLEFERNIRQVLCVWFEDAPTTEKTDFITDVVFRSGSWGRHSDHILASTLKQTKQTRTLLGARVKRLWDLAFIPYYKMKQRYPILVKLPVLLPVFWVVRIVDILFLTRGKLQRHSREFLYTSQENVQAYQQALHYVGLDFHFKE